MKRNNKLEKILLFVEKYFNQLNVFIALTVLALLLIFSGSLFPEKLTSFLERLFENKYWPIVLLLFQIFRKEVEKKNSTSHRDRLAKIEAVIVSGKEIDPGYLLTILKGRDGELSSEMTNNYLDSRMKLDNPIK